MFHIDSFQSKEPVSTAIPACQRRNPPPAPGTIRLFNPHAMKFVLKFPDRNKPVVTLQEMQRALSTLDRVQFTRLVRRWPPVDESNLTDGEQLALAFGEWLAHLNRFSDANFCAIMVWTDVGKQIPVHNPSMVVIADDRYVCCPGKKDWLDLETGVAVQAIPEQAVTLACCNLTALKQRLQRSLELGKSPGTGSYIRA